MQPDNRRVSCIKKIKVHNLPSKLLTVVYDNVEIPLIHGMQEMLNRLEEFYGENPNRWYYQSYWQYWGWGVKPLELKLDSYKLLDASGKVQSADAVLLTPDQKYWVNFVVYPPK